MEEVRLVNLFEIKIYNILSNERIYSNLVFRTTSDYSAAQSKKSHSVYNVVYVRIRIICLVIPFEISLR